MALPAANDHANVMVKTINNKIVFLWSVPRTLSTVMERIIINRGDFKTFHHPFAVLYYKDKFVGEIDEKLNTYEKIVNNLYHQSLTNDIFVKEMCTFSNAFISDDNLLGNIINAFQIRNPAKVILSHHKKNSQVSNYEIGFETQYKLFKKALSITGKVPIVVDADGKVWNDVIKQSRDR